MLDKHLIGGLFAHPAPRQSAGHRSICANLRNIIWNQPVFINEEGYIAYADNTTSKTIFLSQKLLTIIYYLFIDFPTIFSFIPIR